MKIQITSLQIFHMKLHLQSGEMYYHKEHKKVEFSLLILQNRDPNYLQLRIYTVRQIERLNFEYEK